jgi:drug/metabolite transporter (DMT)-like permease
MTDLTKSPANHFRSLWRRVDSHRYAPFLYVLVAMGMFSGQDTISKTLSVDLPPIEIAWVRYAFNVLVLAPLFLRSRLRVLATRQPFVQFMRGILLATSAVFFVAGLRYLPIADATAISFVYPLLVTLFASLALKESIGLSRWLAVIAGFVGALIIIRPGAAGIGSAAVLPLASATSWSVALLLTRRLAVDAALTTLVYSTLSAAFVLSAGLTLGWRPMGLGQVAILFVAALMNVTGQYGLILGYSRRPASSLAPLAYTQLLWSTIAGFMVFSTLPSFSSLLGGLIVAGSGAFVLGMPRRSFRTKSQTAA